MRALRVGDQYIEKFGSTSAVLGMKGIRWLTTPMAMIFLPDARNFSMTPITTSGLLDRLILSSPSFCLAAIAWAIARHMVLLRDPVAQIVARLHEHFTNFNVGAATPSHASP